MRAFQLGVCGLLAIFPFSAEAQTPHAEPSLLGYRITQGAAPGFIEDEACAVCHADIAESYQHSGMAQSFFRPTDEKVIEDFTKSYYHEPSKRLYEMSFRDGTYVFKRDQFGPDQQPINSIEIEAAWVLGSGHNSRTYLYREPNGELFQLPLAWYSQTQNWGMAPGFEAENHLGLTRGVRRGCMFCHNAYPDVEAGSDEHIKPPVFPTSLPEGIGCQRCHGPGAEHVEAALDPSMSDEGKRSAIVNPAKLSDSLRADVCDQCHYQPSVLMFGMRVFGRPDYSYRPGQPLGEYLVQMDVVDADRDRSERFEINHHSDRMRQSPCFQQSAPAMSCLTCHNPHRKVPKQERAAHFRAACLGCHSTPSIQPAHSGQSIETADCVSCHMQRRRTQDVIELLATDHYIRRSPGGAELVAPIVKKDPDIDNVVLLNPEGLPRDHEPDIYRAAAALRALGGAHTGALDFLTAALQEPAPNIEPYVDLARGQIRLNRLAAVKQTAAEILRRSPNEVWGLRAAGLAAIGLNDPETGRSYLEQAVEKYPAQPEPFYNLALVDMTDGNNEEAEQHLLSATKLRPHMAAAWIQLGLVRHRLGRTDEAIAAYKRALAVDPLLTPAYLGLGKVLVDADRSAEARRWYEHGVAASSEPEPIQAALDRLTASPE